MFWLALLILCPRTAAATPVSISIEPWRTSDGNFGFAVIHAATRGLMQMGGMDLHAGGSIKPAPLWQGDRFMRNNEVRICWAF